MLFSLVDDGKLTLDDMGRCRGHAAGMEGKPEAAGKGGEIQG